MPSKPSIKSRNPNPSRRFANSWRSGPLDRSSSGARLARGLALAIFGALTLGTSGCRDSTPRVRVLVAEFQDEDLDGEISQDETIVLMLDRPLPEDLPSTGIRLSSRDLGSADLELQLSPDRQRVTARIRTGRPSFRLEGVHDVDDASSGLRIDLGDGIEQKVDLQRRRVIPKLLSVKWIDGDGLETSATANGVVDRGDRLRLRFDGPVAVTTGAPPEVAVPREILLSKAGIDRLDDGTEPSRWEKSPGDRPDEIDIVLGSNPVLEIHGKPPARWTDNDRTSPRAASALAVNGTKLRPLQKLRSTAAPLGVASDQEVDIAVAERLKERLSRYANERHRLLPERGKRSLHSLTPFLDKYALVTGGLEPGGERRRVLRDVLLLAASAGDDSSTIAPTVQSLADLPRPTFQHTATLLPGPDRRAGTLDDMILIAGGTQNGEDALSDLTVVYLSERSKEVRVQQLAASLRVPRAEHAAVAVRHDQVFIDGGRGGRPRSRSLIGLAELLTIERNGDNLFVTEHGVFHTLARKGHSLTRIEAPAVAADDDSSIPWVLAFGGVGRNPLPGASSATTSPDAGDGPAPRFGTTVERIDASAYFPEESAVVLSAPRLVRIDDPGRSITKLDVEFNATFLRHRHRAVALGEPGSEGLVAASEVFLFGGTLEHPDRGMEGSPRKNWQIPPIDFFTRLGSRPPRLDACFDGILFRFDPKNPAASALEVIPHPTLHPQSLSPKENFTVTRVPGLGVVIAGGETTSGKNGQPDLLDTVEVFFTDGPQRGRLRTLAWPLYRSRSRHQAYFLRAEGRRLLVLVGGLTPDIDEEPGTDIEIFPLP